MNRLTRGLAIAGMAGATLLGGVAMNATTSSAQEDPTSTTVTAPAADSTDAPATAPGREGCEQGPGPHHRGPNLEVAAGAIGIDADALHTALEDGTTLAAIAQDSGVDPQVVIDALVTDVQQHLADEVAQGDLTQDQADQRLADATTRITDHVQNGRPERPADAERPSTPETSAPAGS